MNKKWIIRRGAGGSGVGYDHDAALYFNELTGTIPTAYKTAVNNLVLTLKFNGIWPELDRLWIHAAPNQQNALVSVVNPTSTPITEVNGPTWAANLGYTGNGTSSFLSTNYNPVINGVNYTLNNASFGAYITTDVNEVGLIMGALQGIGASQIRARETNLFYGLVNDFTGLNVGNLSSLGLFCANRTAVNLTKLFKNGVEVSTGGIISTSEPNVDFYLLARNQSGVADGFVTQRLSLSYFGSGNISQSSLYNTIQDLAIELGFNV